MQERCNSGALAMELHLSCINPLIWRSGTHRFLLLVPDLQMSCIDLTMIRRYKNIPHLLCCLIYWNALQVLWHTHVRFRNILIITPKLWSTWFMAWYLTITERSPSILFQSISHRVTAHAFKSSAHQEEVFKTQFWKICSSKKLNIELSSNHLRLTKATIEVSLADANTLVYFHHHTIMQLGG